MALRISRPARFGLAAFTIAAVMAGVPSTAEAAGPGVRDGSTSWKAAASCWEAKQINPAATTGLYWLQTPSLSPTQFYCDMSTDGGGWVLIGRGRENWNWRYDGQRTPNTIASTPTGTGAFAPAAIPSKMVDGLLNGGRVDELSDGVRLVRATHTNGTSWQEVRMKYQSRDRWSWQMEAENPISITFDGENGQVSSNPVNNTTANFQGNNRYNRLMTTSISANGWTRGFSFGSHSSVSSSSSGSSYVYRRDASGATAIPFTQVFVRPKLTQADLNYASIPNGGTPQQTVRQHLGDTTEPLEWGVTGVIGDPSNEHHTEVHALGQVGSGMYVGGYFEYVQKGPNPSAEDRVRQPYLAAFDQKTGEWRPGFRPVLDGPVWDVAALPGNRIAVGGDFKSVNGDNQYAGVVVLDAATGDVDPAFKLRVENNSGAGRELRIRALDVQDGKLYWGGDTTHMVDFGRLTNGAPTSVGAGRMGRFNISDWSLDKSWRPNANGVIMDLDVSSRGDRVYLAGFFTQLNSGNPRVSVGMLSTANGAALLPAGNFEPSATKSYQQAIVETEDGNGVWIGGSEHIIARYDRDMNSQQTSSITKQGGDFQAAIVVDGVLYAGCHCDNSVYEGAKRWPNVLGNGGFQQADAIDSFGAWDAMTGAYLPDFAPGLDTLRNRAAWALTSDSDHCVWFGGDFSSGSGGRWLGGFGKLCQRDTTPPTIPGNFRITGESATELTFGWDASTDTAPIKYEVLWDDRVVASSWGRSVTLPKPDGSARYWVRAVDDEGNVSASSPMIHIAPTPTSTELVSYGSTWKYRHQDGDPGDWTTLAFDDGAWPSGAAELGFGDGDEVTVIPALSAPRPMSAQFRTTFQVTNPNDITELSVDVVRDDGAVVYLNGQELGRTNMPGGAVTFSTPAVAGLPSPGMEREVITIPVDPSRLRSGANVLAISVHQADAWSADLSMRARLTATTG